MKKEGYILSCFIVLVIGSIVAAILAKRRLGEKQKVYDQIVLIINNNIGAKGVDVSSLLLNTKPDPAYKPAADIAKLIKAPNSKLLGLSDDDEAVYSVIKKLSARQLKTLDNQLQNDHGKSLDEYLKGIFSSITDCRKLNPFGDCTYPKYEKAIAMIKSKKV